MMNQPNNNPVVIRPMATIHQIAKQGSIAFITEEEAIRYVTLYGAAIPVGTQLVVEITASEHREFPIIFDALVTDHQIYISSSTAYTIASQKVALAVQGEAPIVFNFVDLSRQNFLTCFNNQEFALKFLRMLMVARYHEEFWTGAENTHDIGIGFICLVIPTLLETLRAYTTNADPGMVCQSNGVTEAMVVALQTLPHPHVVTNHFEASYRALILTLSSYRTLTEETARILCTRRAKALAQTMKYDVPDEETILKIVPIRFILKFSEMMKSTPKLRESVIRHLIVLGRGTTTTAYVAHIRQFMAESQMSMFMAMYRFCVSRPLTKAHIHRLVIPDMIKFMARYNKLKLIFGEDLIKYARILNDNAELTRTNDLPHLSKYGYMHECRLSKSFEMYVRPVTITYDDASLIGTIVDPKYLVDQATHLAQYKTFLEEQGINVDQFLADQAEGHPLTLQDNNISDYKDLVDRVGATPLNQRQ